jgi:hypothetical protein
LRWIDSFVFVSYYYAQFDSDFKSIYFYFYCVFLLLNGLCFYLVFLYWPATATYLRASLVSKRRDQDQDQYDDNDGFTTVHGTRRNNTDKSKNKKGSGARTQQSSPSMATTTTSPSHAKEATEAKRVANFTLQQFADDYNASVEDIVKMVSANPMYVKVKSVLKRPTQMLTVNVYCSMPDNRKLKLTTYFDFQFLTTSQFQKQTDRDSKTILMAATTKTLQEGYNHDDDRYALEYWAIVEYQPAGKFGIQPKEREATEKEVWHSWIERPMVEKAEPWQKMQVGTVINQSGKDYDNYVRRTRSRGVLFQVNYHLPHATDQGMQLQSPRSEAGDWETLSELQDKFGVCLRSLAHVAPTTYQKCLEAHRSQIEALGVTVKRLDAFVV